LIEKGLARVGEGYQRIGGQCESITSRIKGLPDSARVAIAVSAAQRLMDEHMNAPEGLRNAFAVGWAPALSLVWQILVSQNAEADRPLRDRLEEYYSGPYCHELGDEALPGADEDAAAAAIYTVEAYCRRNARSAASAALLLLSAADARADPFVDDPMSTQAEEIRVRFEQEEVDRLTSGLALLEREGVTRASLEELCRIFEIRPA
jgi:hypothetical protein